MRAPANIQQLRRDTIATVEAATDRTVPTVPWMWNNRITRCLGRIKRRRVCVEFGQPAEMRAIHLELSAKCWPHLTDAERTTILIHECCHLIEPGDGHGRRWQTLMRRCGQDPARRLDTNATDQAQGPTILLYCGCPEPVETAARAVARMVKRGLHRYTCCRCHQTPKRVPDVSCASEPDPEGAIREALVNIRALRDMGRSKVRQTDDLDR